MPCSVTQLEARVVFGTVISPSPVHPKGQYQGAGSHKQPCCKCCIPSDVCLHFHNTSPTRGICCLLLYCWEKWTRACWWPHRIVHCGRCSIKYTGLLAKDNSPGDHICCMFGASIHLPLWEGSPLPLALNFLASPLYCWVRSPTSLSIAAGDMDILAK